MAKRHPFPFTDESNAVYNAFSREARCRLEKIQLDYICTENVQSFTHGCAWQSHNSSDPDNISELKVHSHEFGVKTDDIVNGRLDVIESCISGLVDAMHSSLARSMFDVASQACDKTGNIVSAGNEPAQAFLKMLQMIQFGVDYDGKVSLPTIYAGSAVFNAIARDPLSKTPEFIAAVEAVTERKSEEALAAELERKSKFVREL